VFKYFPHTIEDIEEMKNFLKINKIDDLFQDVPKEVLFQKEYNIPSHLSESELRRYFEKIASKNKELILFTGLGFYDHYEPAVINSLLSRQEFLTAYTPYQPEISQGTLQYIFEYQSMIQTLTGMDVSNASMYDGTTSTAEACFMAESITKRKTILISGTVHPSVIDVVRTYAKFKGLTVEIINEKSGITDLSHLQQLLGSHVAGVVVQKPNFFGIIESFEEVSKAVHEHGAILIENADISTLSVLKTPRLDGADIAVGDCQSLGMNVAYGGPTLGYLATLKPYVRKMPGRICGYSLDEEGRRAFVLTLQAREQHIRREKANSNICSNQSLMALYATIYLALLGPIGLKKANLLSYQGAHYLYDELIKTGKFKPYFNQPFFKEFVLETLIPYDMLQKACIDNGFLAGISLSNYDEKYQNLVTFAVTEKRQKSEIDELVSLVGGLSW